MDTAVAAALSRRGTAENAGGSWMCKECMYRDRAIRLSSGRHRSLTLVIVTVPGPMSGAITSRRKWVRTSGIKAGNEAGNEAGEEAREGEEGGRR